MERLVRWDNVSNEELRKAENPFFATTIVRRHLQSRGYIQDLAGLADLLRSCSLYRSRALTGDEIEIVLRAVESGEWLLLKKKPFSPVEPAKLWYSKSCKSKTESESLGFGGFCTSGPGKWKTVTIKINKVASGVAFLANNLTSRWDEGRVFLSSGSDFANTSRTVTQRWVPFSLETREFAGSSAVHRYGTVREITQYYVRGDDPWDISGMAWHWRPVVANEVYEFKEGGAE